jgi:hypothetical protein
MLVAVNTLFERITILVALIIAPPYAFLKRKDDTPLGVGISPIAISHTYVAMY